MEVVGDFEYNKRDLIGHGAFAVVFKGRYRKSHDLPVAIKSITKKNLAKSQALLTKEIKILKELSGLHHENVVALLDCTETNQNLYLVMEYCNGGDLAEYLLAKGTLSEDTIALFLKQIAGAMQALNAKGIVHRDLKPQNLLLCHSGRPNPPASEIRLKIADFGFARFLQDGVMAGTLCGSPMYMAPEVIMSQQYCAKADLWSIGTIVYQCLTGRAPFQAQTPQQLKLYYERNAQLVPAIPSGTSPLLHDLLTRLLKRNPVERIEFVDFFIHAFVSRTSPSSVATAPVPVPNARRSDACDSGGSGASSSSLKVCVSVSPLSGKSTGTGFRVPPPPPSSLPAQPEPLVGDIAEVAAARSAAAARPSSRASVATELEEYVLVPNISPSSDELYVALAGRAAVEYRRRSPQQQGAVVAASPPAPSSSLPRDHPRTLVARVGSEAVAFPSLPTVGSLPLEPATYVSPASGLSRLGTLPSQGSPTPLKDTASQQASGVAIMRHRSSSSSAVTDITSLTPPAVQFTVGTPPVASGFHRRTGVVSSPPASLSLAKRGSIDEDRLLYHVQTSPAALLSIGSSPPRSALTIAHGGTDQLRTAGSASRQFTAAAEPQHQASSWKQRLSFGASPTPSLGSLQTPPTVPSMMSTMAGPTAGASDKQLPRRHGGSSELMNSPVGSPVPFSLSAMPGQQPFFMAPELAEETLMSDEHNEMLTKLSFILTLVESIVDLAAIRSSPLTDSKLASKVAGCVVLMSEQQRRLEQLVLYVRALHVLSTSLQLAKKEVAAGRLQPSSAMRNVVREMGARYRSCLDMCKLLRSKGVNMAAGVDQEFLNSTADKLIYEHAIDLCRQAALDELFGNLSECVRRYKSAHILLHSLAQMADLRSDQELLTKYKREVEKRLYYLQNQGYVLAFDS